MITPIGPDQFVGMPAFPNANPNPLDSQFGATYQVTAGAAFSQRFLRDSSTDPQGKAWVVNLSAWKAVNNVVANLEMAALIVTVEVATAGGSESFSIDYPFTGTSFCVHGAQLTVTISGVGPVLPSHSPILGAWLTVDTASGRNANSLPTQTLTTAPSILLFPLGVASFVAPPRARAFRFFVPEDLNSFTLTLSQFGGPGGTMLALDHATAAAVPNDSPSNRAGWYPLHPQATTVIYVNTAPEQHTIAHQWLIDTTG